MKHQGIDCLLLSLPANITYVTGYLSRDSWLLLLKEGGIYITDARYTQEARKNLKRAFIVKQSQSSLLDTAAAVIKELRIKRLGFEEKHLTAYACQKLSSRLPKTTVLTPTQGIIESSREIKSPQEIEKIKQRYNTPGVEIPCAKDGITIFLNAQNPVKELTIQQLSGIFQGKIKNWKEVGGPDAPITLYGRENSSGTYVFFKDNVVKGDYAASCNTLPGTAAVVNAVKKDKFGIGYGGAAYAEGVKHCAVKKDASSPAYMATAETIKSKQYPISRDLYMYTANRPTGDIKKYIDWILSPEGQKYVTEIGYFPVK